MSTTAFIGMLALLLALLIDRCFGEPPLRWHPVVWMGNYLRWAGQRVQRVASQTALGRLPGQPDDLAWQVPQNVPDYKAFWLAALYWSAAAAFVSIASWWLEKTILQMHLRLPDGLVASTGAGFLTAAQPLLAGVLLALLLKPMLAWAMLKSEVLAVDVAVQSSLLAGRERLSWLVSRDTAALSAAQVRESAIESLAENLNDSVVAPIFWFVLLGLPGAVLYRFANTADAMWGYQGLYHGQNWEWAGKWAARADDLLGWAPARLTAWLLAVTCGLRWAEVAREAAKTPSPNSGWPMAAMALALNVRLGKPGVYVLNPAGHAPGTAAMTQAVFHASKVLPALMVIALTAIYLISLWQT